MKKFVSFIILLLFTAYLNVGVFAESAGSAENAGFAGESNVTNARTPYDKGYVEILFSTDEAETAGVPLTYDEFLLSPTGNKIHKISEKTGETEMTAELDEKVSENSRGVVINDVLLQPAKTKLFAVNLENMSVKCSRQFGEIITDVAAIDSLVYFGVKNDGGYSFICADLNKELEIVWEYKTENKVTSAGLYGDLIVFGAGEKLVVHQKDENNYVENETGEKINYVFAGKYAIFMSAENGIICKVRLEADGTVEEGSLMSVEAGGELSAPVEYENKLFISSTNGFHVVDALNMEIIKTYEELKNGCAPVVTTGGGGLRAYVVSPVESEGKWYLYSVLDNNDELSLSEIVKIIDFTDGKIAVSDSGIMYFRDAKGQIYALSVRGNDIFTIIIKLLLFIAIIVFLILILRAWVKKHSDKRPKFT